MFIDTAPGRVPHIVNETGKTYINDRARKCDELYQQCMSLTDNQIDHIGMLIDIYTSERESTKKAINDNLEEFHELVRVHRRPPESKEHSPPGGSKRAKHREGGN